MVNMIEDLKRSLRCKFGVCRCSRQKVKKYLMKLVENVIFAPKIGDKVSLGLLYGEHDRGPQDDRSVANLEFLGLLEKS